MRKVITEIPDNYFKYKKVFGFSEIEKTDIDRDDVSQVFWSLHK